MKKKMKERKEAWRAIKWTSLQQLLKNLAWSGLAKLNQKQIINSILNELLYKSIGYVKIMILIIGYSREGQNFWCGTGWTF